MRCIGKGREEMCAIWQISLSIGTVGGLAVAVGGTLMAVENLEGHAMALVDCAAHQNASWHLSARLVFFRHHSGQVLGAEPKWRIETSPAG